MSGNFGSGAYTPRYAKTPAKYSPKRTVKSFRDLDVYRITTDCALTLAREVLPILEKDKFSLVDGMRDCALSIPLRVAEAHGMRFSDFAVAVRTLESAMQGCNKMIVYLEQASGLSYNVDVAVLEEFMQKYLQVRGKMLRLERSWQKFQANR